MASNMFASLSCGDLRVGFEDKSLRTRIKQAQLYRAQVDKTLQEIQVRRSCLRFICVLMVLLMAGDRRGCRRTSQRRYAVMGVDELIVGLDVRGSRAGFVEPNIEHRVLVECSDGLFHAFSFPRNNHL